MVHSPFLASFLWQRYILKIIKSKKLQVFFVVWRKYFTFVKVCSYL